MDAKELKKLIAQGEGVRLDFKKEIRPEGVGELSKDFAAFANTEGGQLLVGVTDDKKIVGAELPQDLQLKIHDEAHRCKPSILIHIEEVPVYRTSVFVISVPKGKFIHADSAFRFHERIGNTTVAMDFSMLYSLARSKQLLGTESPPEYFLPAQERRKPTEAHQYLFDNSMGSNEEIAREALKDIVSLGYSVRVEEHPEFVNLLRKSLTSHDQATRQEAMNLLGSIEYRLPAKKKEKILAELAIIVRGIALGDESLGLRSYAITLLSIFGVKDVVDVMMTILKESPKNSNQSLDITNSLRPLVDKGNGNLLRRRLYEELEKTDDEEVKKRIKKTLETLRSLGWSS